MKEARTIYLSKNKSVRDVGFGFGEDGVSHLGEDQINRESLYKSCDEASAKFGSDFTVIYRDSQLGPDVVIFRGRRVLTSVGEVYALREIHKGLPSLRDDSLNIPNFYKEIASHNFLLSGGIFLISGATGNGKSTTMAATLINRLMVFGGFAVTIEDPVEYQMTGKIGKGYCFQMPVCEENGGDFSGAIKASLRMYPSKQKSTVLVIGEIRDSKTAAEVLRESINGHLILTTIHANDVMTAITRILTLASQEIGAKEAQDLLSQSLRVIAHQRFINGKPNIKCLINDGKSSQISSRIRSGEVYTLNSEIIRQNNILVQTGKLPLEGR